jgi:hypothetical protein
VEEDGPVKEREQTWIEGGEDEEPEEDFLWIKESIKKDAIKFEKETYFTFVNEMRKPMPKGTQAWNCYGNRTNIFLLVNYGFCFQDNRYDSVKFYVRLDADFEKDVKPEVDKLIV